jgi:hypothetical protein
LTCSIVVLAIWGVVLTLAHVERGRLVDELATRIACGTEREAIAALQQMARMPNPPLETFAVAAASPTRVVARQAQDSIGELLRKWRGQLKSNRSASRVAARLERLAAALDAEREMISALDYPWLAKTTEKILRLANAAPQRDALDLAIHCESLLTTASARRSDTHRDVLPAASAAIDRAPDVIFSPPSRFALQAIVPEAEATDIHAVETPQSPPDAASNLPDSQLRWSRPGLDQSSQAPLPRRFDRRHNAALKAASPIPVADSANTDSIVPDPWATIDSRALFERWLNVSGTPNQQIERELTRRGFGSLRSDVVRQALSDDTAGRVQLVQDLLAMPAVGAKAWLIFFADDADAEVRLAAVTVMVTSNDGQLLEKAWQVALHDHDPRIASLAERLRNRRTNTQRR